MAISYATNSVTRTNPFDGTSETVKAVTQVFDGSETLRTSETFEFATTATDAEILAAVTASLAAKGYPV